MEEVLWSGTLFGFLNSMRLMAHWDILPFVDSAVDDLAVFESLLWVGGIEGGMRSYFTEVDI